MDAMRRRGPDGEGLFSANGIALGHTRLAVIDIETGAQPMTDPETGCVLVFNGEIYNYRDIRRSLDAEGIPFVTHSDTEVLLKALARWGTGCLEKLSGMFAFAFYNPAEKTLFLARDRAGVKPLFYSVAGGSFIFASSMKAMLCFDAVGKSADLDVCSHYLATLRTTMGARTLVRGVSTLLPGECLEVSGAAGRVKTRKYWDFPVLTPSEKPNIPFERACETVSSLFADSVKEQLVSDVPLGGFLSGGLDSAVLSSLAAELTGHKFDAYGTGYDLDGYSEWPYIRMAAAFNNMRCKEVRLVPEQYPEAWAFLTDEKGLPVSTPNEIPIMHLASALKNDFTVALSGEGADEVFGGYVLSYFSARDYDRARRVPPQPGEQLTVADRAAMRLYRQVCMEDRLTPYFILNSWISPAQKSRLLTPESLGALKGDEAMLDYYTDLAGKFSGCSTFDCYMHMHARINLEGLLFRVDSSTMAASVEGRVPYTDHRLMEFAFTMPDFFKIRWKDDAAMDAGEAMNAREADAAGLLESKALLRRAFAGRVPPDIVARPKMSFPVPVREWFGGFLRETASKHIMESKFCGTLFDREQAGRLIACAELPQSGHVLWPVTSLCMWQNITGVSL